MKNLKSEIENNLVNYFANNISSQEFVNKHILNQTTIELGEKKEAEICEILAQSQSDWDAMPCDAEGATKEQDAKMDTFLSKISNDILDIVKTKYYIEIWTGGYLNWKGETVPDPAYFENEEAAEEAAFFFNEGGKILTTIYKTILNED